MIVGLGMDLVEIARIERLLAERGDRAIARLFTAAEAAYAAARSTPAVHFAGRFAAKEAAYKALSGSELARGIGWRELEVVKAWDGRPSLLLHGRAGERARELGVSQTMLTMTHSELTAGAVVVLLGG
jgi:holo-[acyl-carrier protein] synthase